MTPSLVALAIARSLSDSPRWSIVELGEWGDILDHASRDEIAILIDAVPELEQLEKRAAKTEELALVLTTTRDRLDRAEQGCALLRTRLEQMTRALEALRALKPRRMGDHWAWEMGLPADDVAELVEEGLKPVPAKP